MIRKENAEISFVRRVSNKNTERIKLTVYINYVTNNYTIVSPNEEAVKLEGNCIERLSAHIALLREAMNFIKKELKTK